MAGQPEINNLALFCDFENIALGVRDSRYASFDIRRVLERLLLKGSIVVKKAYCDWDRYKDFKRPMHEANFELIEIPHVRQSGKNSADIRMVVDALDLCYTKAHVDAFVIISGDSDFSPLVSKLRENNKYVIGIGVRDSTSDLLAANCDEFIFYDDLVRETKRTSRTRKPVAARTADATDDANGGAAKSPVGSKPMSRRSAADGSTAKDAGAISAQATGAPAVDVVATGPAATGPVATGPGATGPGATGPSATGPTETSLTTKRPAARGQAAKRSAAKNTAAPSTTQSPAAKSRRRGRKDAVETESAAALGDDDHTPTDSHSADHDDDRRHEALDLLVETIEALAAERGDDEKLWGSMVKQTMKRRRPGFNESSYGYKSFRELVDDAAQRNLLIVVKDERPGQYALRVPAS